MHAQYAGPNKEYLSRATTRINIKRHKGVKTELQRREGEVAINSYIGEEREKLIKGIRLLKREAGWKFVHSRARARAGEEMDFGGNYYAERFFN